MTVRDKSRRGFGRALVRGRRQGMATTRVAPAGVVYPVGFWKMTMCCRGRRSSVSAQTRGCTEISRRT